MTTTPIETGFELTVNGAVLRFTEQQSTELLVDFLRDRLGHTDVKLACGEGACCACSVLVDGESVPSCTILLGRVRGREVRTPANLASDPIGERIAGALVAHGGLQCGFCTPGILCSIYGLATKDQAGEADASTGALAEADIASALGGHICRCTGYRGILEAARTVLGAAAEGSSALSESRD